MSVHMFGSAAIATGVFRAKGGEGGKPYVRGIGGFSKGASGCASPQTQHQSCTEPPPVNGLRVSNNDFLLNGVDNNEFGLGGVVVLPPPDAIQEFRTEENSMSAEFGRGGAAVNVVVKSGTNRIHGGAFEFIRNDALDARNYFASPSPAPKPGFKRNQFGGFLGGPIKKDKTFIFGDYQATRIREALSYVSTVPTADERTGNFGDRLTQTDV